MTAGPTPTGPSSTGPAPTGPVVDFLNAADWVVPDLGPAHARVAELLPALEPTGELHIPEHDFATVFLRGSAALTVAPTRVQLVSLTAGGTATPPGCAVAPFAPMQDAQGRGRGQRVHGTVLAVRDFESSVARLRARGVPVFVEHECSHLPYRRAWLGWSGDGRGRIDGFDAGLFLELIPIEVFPAAVGASVTAVRPADPPVLRVAARSHLVADLEQAVGELETYVGLVPSGYDDDALLGFRAARYTFRHAGGADLVLAQPYGGGPAEKYLSDHGPGAYLATLACHDLTAAAASALAAGAGVLARTDTGARRVVLDDSATGFQLELTQAPELTQGPELAQGVIRAN